MTKHYTYHRDYKTCNLCGANLDFNESCNCQEPKYYIKYQIGTNTYKSGPFDTEFDAMRHLKEVHGKYDNGNIFTNIQICKE